MNMISLLWSEGELKPQAFLPQPSNGVLHLEPLQLHKYELFAAMLQFCMLTNLQIKGRRAIQVHQSSLNSCLLAL